jgi:hypothetical protein
MSTRIPCAGHKTPRPLRSLSGNLMQTAFAGLLLCASVEAAQAAVAVPRHLINPDAPRIEDPDSLVHRYLQAVDRGELVIFGQKLDRSMIVPVRIEYVYELASRTTRIKVHSNLKTPLPVPGHGDCHVLTVSTVIEDGHITTIETHIWMK